MDGAAVAESELTGVCRRRHGIRVGGPGQAGANADTVRLSTIVYKLENRPRNCGEYREAIMIKLTLRLLAVALLLALPQLASAQRPPPPSQPASAPPQQLLAAGQLEALVAPIALYPDALLSEISWPRPIRWKSSRLTAGSEANKNLQGRCAQGRGRPAELGRQREVAGGDARRARHDEPEARVDAAARRRRARPAGRCMDAIQRLRTKAQANNKLRRTPTDGYDATAGRQAGDRHCANRPGHDLRALLRSVRRLRPWPYPDYPAYYWPPRPISPPA